MRQPSAVPQELAVPAPDRYTITRIATRTTIAMLNAKTQFRVFGGAA
jgi:hypothetical protein